MWKNMTRPAYLGMQHAPFETADPSSPGYKPPQLSVSAQAVSLLDDRRRLLAQVDRYRREADASGESPVD